MKASLAAVLCVACMPLLAQERPSQPEGVSVEARGLPASSQGKKSEAADIVVTIAHAPGDAVKCDKNASRGCSDAEHWLVEVRVGKGDLGKTFALADTGRLKKELEWAASPRAKTKHTEGVNISDATMSFRVAGGTPYRLVQRLLEISGSAGIHRIEFAVVPVADAAEQRLLVPLPADVTPVLVDHAKDAPPDVRVSLYVDARTGACIRTFGHVQLASDGAGDAKLVAMLKDSHADRVRVGYPDAPCIIDAAAGVPWQAVVGVIDACQAAGIPVRFAAAPIKK